MIVELIPSKYRNEMLKFERDEMVESLIKICNKVMEVMKVPVEWEDMKVKSISKNKGSKTEMGNRRGIFLTSIISKIFEKVLMEKTNKQITTSEYENGGKRGRSTKDNWLALMAILDNAKRRGESCVLLFADAEKCFDHLWLEDCLVDLNEARMREREILILLKMNEKARIQVDTTFGKTKEINLEKIVKQGTVYGPQLCCVSTDKINGMGYDSTTVWHRL